MSLSYDDNEDGLLKLQQTYNNCAKCNKMQKWHIYILLLLLLLLQDFFIVFVKS